MTTSRYKLLHLKMDIAQEKKKYMDVIHKQTIIDMMGLKRGSNKDTNKSLLPPARLKG